MELPYEMFVDLDILGGGLNEWTEETWCIMFLFIFVGAFLNLMY